MPLDYTVTYDPETLIGEVRATLQDVAVFGSEGDVLPDGTTPRAQWSVIFLDQEIQVKLNRHAGAVNQSDLAAADLLEDAASNSALLAKLTRLGSYISDTRTSPDTIRKQADALRARYDKAQQSGSLEPAEAIGEEVWTDFDWRRSIWNNTLQG